MIALNSKVAGFARRAQPWLENLTRKVALRRPQYAFLFILVGLFFGCQPQEKSASSPAPTKSNDKSVTTMTTNKFQVTKSDDEWHKILTPEQYRVLRQAGTEQAFGKAYEDFKNEGGGTYVCAACGAELFSSKEKFDSHCGWPSFYDPANAKNVITRDDVSFGTVRTEVICAQCGGHLGHVFKGEGFNTPTDQRYCINSVSLKFIPANGAKAYGGKP
jgi:peptide-methionine (R)-S-oxide reductase